MGHVCCEVVIFVIPCLILAASSGPVVHHGYKLLCILKFSRLEDVVPRPARLGMAAAGRGELAVTY